jgi:hypothetical protein
MTCASLAFLLALVTDPNPPDDVRHEPAAPKPGAAVLVTARLPAGATQPALEYQAVAPGKYVRLGDPEYKQPWTRLPLRDDGQEGDAAARDGVYSVRVPGTVQQHRWLIRYRVVAVLKDGGAFQAPGPDDECPNYAWWCDAGPAAWTGTRDPGKTPPLTFSPEFLGTIQSLTLLARSEDVAKSQWDPGAHKQKQQGTLVYRGVAYDHIHYSNRGQGSAHISGKNKWGIKFSKGRNLPLLDPTGAPFPATFDSLNLNPGGSTPYLPVHRGISGLDEVMSMRAYRLAGVPSPTVTWVQWRVVSGEASTRATCGGSTWRSATWSPTC